MTETGFPVFEAPYAPDDVTIARALMAEPLLTPEQEQNAQRFATELITAIRSESRKVGGIEELLREYSLSTREGLALMVLAEALLRIPDAATVDKLIEDKIGQGNFEDHEQKSDTLLISASTWALGLTSKIIQQTETPEGILQQLTKRLGMPALRTAVRQAMKIMGSHFVFGQTIEDALKRRTSNQDKAAYRYSFDMLGEGARTAADARRYYQGYASAIEAIARVTEGSANTDPSSRPGISVKLSGLHPHYEATSENRVMEELLPGVIALARQAKDRNIGFTIDAEEADRLELSLDLFARVIADPSLQGWKGLGLAVQAYQKRAEDVIDFVADLARRHNMPVNVRLVKGAYWDTEIKRAQERGLRDYPVFTRKAVTDLNYIHCARKLLDLRPLLFPQFATHNALTVAALLEIAGDEGGFEFQRLHGMGDVLYRTLLTLKPGLPCRVYAPVGPHRDLLAYLVRRILENGANASFVSMAADPTIPVSRLLLSPVEIIGKPEAARHPKLPRPPLLYGPDRINSLGVELGYRTKRETIASQLFNSGSVSYRAISLVNGKEMGDEARTRAVISPIDSETAIGEVTEADTTIAYAAIAAARKGHPGWAHTLVDRRAEILRAAADMLEEQRSCFLYLLQAEAGKTIDDALAEVREAVDFLRYYALSMEEDFAVPLTLPGPTGESNRMMMRSRGVFIAISPWNFPLAIFIGQVAAALAAGNSVVAKPAEQTPLIAAEAVRIMHEAGIPETALHLVLGDGTVGSALVAEKEIDGVAFTGSFEVARHINRSLAAKDGMLVPLIAETGGINAMIVDATALPEQVCDDIITSAFRSAGQRCSALRVLCVQEDIADRLLELVTGATEELTVGDPRDFATQVGPVIDPEAKQRLVSYLAEAEAEGRILYAGATPERGIYVAPHIVSLKRFSDLKHEVFGPVLHVVRFKRDELETVISDIMNSGYGLTLGIHSRIDSFIVDVTRHLPIGNIYVNRNMIGAVVGVQPFGGNGLSGTGPKAGGPNYLHRFAIEQTISINTAAVGGNAALIALEDIEE